MKAIIFDMDGLLVDTEQFYVMSHEKMAAGFGKEITYKSQQRIMGRRPHDAMRVFAEELELDTPVQTLVEMRDEMVGKMLMENVIPMKGLFEILNEFKGKMKLAVATGSPEKFLKLIMERLGMRHYFDVIHTAENVTKGKPDPEIYLKTLGILGVAPGDAVVMEDSRNGALAGKSAGCYTIAIPNMYTKMQDFSFVDFKAQDLNHAREHVKEKLL